MPARGNTPFTACPLHEQLAMPGLLGGISDKDSKGAGRQPGYPTTPLHSGSRFVGHQQSKGNKYVVEVVFKVSEDIASPPPLYTVNSKRD